MFAKNILLKFFSICIKISTFISSDGCFNRSESNKNFIYKDRKIHLICSRLRIISELSGRHRRVRPTIIDEMNHVDIDGDR